MTELITIPNITFAISITVLLFTVYNFYLKGQKEDGNKITNTEKSDIILAKDIQLLRTELTGEIKNMVSILAVELKNLTDAFHLIKANDLHSIYEKQRDQDSQINKLTNAITALQTIIDERVPRKTVDKVS